jgi:hypothetical protein
MTMARMRTPIVLAIAVAVVTAAGCGGSDKPLTQKEQVAKAIHDFNVAFSKGDGKKACSLITDVYRNSIEQGRSESCEQAVADENATNSPEYTEVKALGKAKVVDVQIVEGVATGDLVGPGVGDGPPAQAQQQDGRWLVSATGRGTL